MDFDQIESIPEAWKLFNDWYEQEGLSCNEEDKTTFYQGARAAFNLVQNYLKKLDSNDQEIFNLRKVITFQWAPEMLRSLENDQIH